MIDLAVITRDTQMRYAQVREDPDIQGLTSRAFLEVVAAIVETAISVSEHNSIPIQLTNLRKT